jgi:hypothetical protein
MKQSMSSTLAGIEAESGISSALATVAVELLVLSAPTLSVAPVKPKKAPMWLTRVIAHVCVWHHRCLMAAIGGNIVVVYGDEVARCDLVAGR